MKFKKELVGQGRKIEWHPSHMRSRYENWVEGLNTDWCISRQRFFGIPFPVWYPINAEGEPDYSNPICAKAENLPVDPSSDTPPGFKESQRNQPGGFVGDPDVMDTWATSSMTPQIQSSWLLDPAKHKKLFPMDIRPQAHEIIRTWAFSTIVKAWMHENEIPWKHVVISGWILDPDRKKMSKSKGNVVTPDHLLDEYSSDAVRYWAARARLGTDTAFDPAVFKIGSKLVIKLFNASRFVLMQLKDPVPGIDKISAPLDKAIVQVLSNVVKRATDSFDKFEYAEALQATEECFWNFCDHYLELVKARSYSETDTTGRESAQATLFWTLKTFTRLFAPFMPYITEEIWSWRFQGSGKDASVHSTAWPSVSEVSSIKGDPAAFHAAVDVLGVIRGKKTEAQKGQRWGVSKLSVKAADVDLTILKTVLDDVLKAGGVDSNGLTLASNAANGGKKFEVELALAEAEEPKKA